MLTVQQKLQRERSISACFYILQGNASIQTIQDTKLYRLHRFFGIYKSLRKKRYVAIIDDLVKEQYLIKQEETNHYLLTDKAKQHLILHNANTLYLNGEKYHSYDQLYLLRLTLLIQVWTNSHKSHFTFIPVVENKEVEQWVKTLYRQTKHDINEHLQVLYGELYTIFTQVEETDAEIFIAQFSGYETIGQTTSQLAHTYQKSKEDIYLITKNIVHFMLKEIEMKREKYPLLSMITTGLKKTEELTASTTRTKRLLDKGLTPAEIAKIRRLKLNTIYDHLVEMAIKQNEFPLTAYVNPSDIEQIRHVIEGLHTYKLKTIKAAVSEEISYFQIRLVLARFDR